MSIIDFARQILELKRVKRSGWVLHGVRNSESVMDHIGSVAVLAMILARNFDVDRSLSSDGHGLSYIQGFDFDVLELRNFLPYIL